MQDVSGGTKGLKFKKQKLVKISFYFIRKPTFETTVQLVRASRRNIIIC